MRIALIGSGRVATCMGPQLKAAGHAIACVYSRTMANALELADTLGAPATDSLQSLPVADVYLTMLTDDALVELAPAIVKGRENALFLHTAGSVPMDIWKEAGAKRYGVLYAMQTFSKGFKKGYALEFNRPQETSHSSGVCLQFCQPHVCHK